MNVTVTVVSRATLDQPFTQLVAPSVLTLSGDTLGYTPVLPPGSDALELRLRVTPVGNAIGVNVGSFLDPAHPPQPIPILDADGVQVGEQPAPKPEVWQRFGVWDGATRDLPFGSHQSFLFRRPGVAA
ncbi:hypothetical protein [Methylobacterium sp. 1973]|uniref:hypothetical protein n=1 Tax=Methylobacterium sp. 1973 TaxID=3156421 RepID=UPI003398BFEB